MSYQRLHFIFNIAIVLAAVAVFYYSGFLDKGHLTIEGLGMEINADPDKLYEWRLSDEAPFKFRILFKSLVTAVYSITGEENDSERFHVIYIFWSFVFFLSTPLLLFTLLRKELDSIKWSFIGTILYFSLPAVLFAYKYPVHTREDFLGYTILLLGLLLLRRKANPLICLLLFIAASACRETLLIIPLCYLLFYKNHKLPIKVLVITPAFLFFFFIRLADTSIAYDLLGGFKWNSINWHISIIFLYLTFSSIWFLLMIPQRVESNSIVQTSSTTAITIILATATIFGILVEIRLMFLSFPWVLTISLLKLKKVIESKQWEYFWNQKKILIISSFLIVIISMLVIFPFIKLTPLYNYHEEFSIESWALYLMLAGGTNIWLMLVYIIFRRETKSFPLSS